MILGVPREGRKSSKIEKVPSKNRSKKSTKKKRRPTPWRDQNDGHRAAQGIQRFRSGRLLPSPENKSKTRQHSRRSAADCCSLTRGPPHSTSLLALADVQRIAQNLGGSCQYLAKSLATSTRILPTKCNRFGQTQCPEIVKKSCKNVSNAGVRRKEGLQDRLLLIFGDFGGPQGGPKIIKNRKKAFQKSIEKKDEKKRQ